MKRLFKNKKLMTLALVAALGLAVYLNYAMSSSPSLSANTDATDPEPGENLGDATFVGAQVSTPTDTSEENPDFFEQARQNRIAAREEALSIVQEVMDSATASAEGLCTAADVAKVAENTQ